jgi:two-component system LytT family response regulator
VNYTKVVTSHKREIILPKTLKFVEAMLPPHLFARIHKSVLVNLNYIKGYYRADGSHIKLLDGTILPVSHRKRDALVNKLVKRPFPSENGHQKMDPDEEPFIERPNTKLS